jgi:hypothetical protein
MYDVTRILSAIEHGNQLAALAANGDHAGERRANQGRNDAGISARDAAA